MLPQADVQVAEREVLKGAGARPDDLSVIFIESPNEPPFEAPPRPPPIYRFFYATCLRYAHTGKQLNSKKPEAP
jgi:hypothetical protein